MRSAISAIVIAVGLAGFAAGAQATPLSATMPAGAAADTSIVHVQMMPGERRMMHHRMERRMMHRHMERRMMRHHMERRMMRRRMMHNM